MKHSYQHAILITLGMVLLSAGGWCSLKVHRLSNDHEQIRRDFSDVNNVTLGLLSVNQWKSNFVRVAEKQINEFSLSEGPYDTLKLEIEQLLHAGINKADSLLHEKQKTLGGKIKSFMARTLINEKKIHARVPEFSETILKELTKKQSKDRLKGLVRSKLENIAADTYDSTTDRQLRDSILTSYHASTIRDFNDMVSQRADRVRGETYMYTYIVTAIIGIFAVAWFLIRKKKHLHTCLFILSVLLALEVLVAGLTTPMIEIDARIEHLDFHLAGTELSFDEQVIFFQSKSILDVVEVLLKTKKSDSMLVGVLILVFSIVFPIFKLISAGMYLLYERVRHSKLVHFFAFKSGKWSMADVQVIAIFMAFIGFKGILEDQLSHLDIDSGPVTSIATNHTTLQPGYILFISFVLFGLILSAILKRIAPESEQ